MRYIEDTRYFSERQLLKKKCKHCGHTQAIHSQLDKVICRWCHNYIFRTEQDEFRYKIKENQIKERRKNK